MKLLVLQLKILAPFVVLSFLFLFLEALFPQIALIHVLSNGSDYLLLALGFAVTAPFFVVHIKGFLPNQPVLSTVLGILLCAAVVVLFVYIWRILLL